jgi:tRNA (adenine37-N6)-methyltransferase
LKERVGIFSTRSPHRPNPIGMTLAKIERVDGRNRTVHLSALDLIDGTPVLDIKPYVPGKTDVVEIEGLRYLDVWLTQC